MLDWTILVTSRKEIHNIERQPTTKTPIVSQNRTRPSGVARRPARFRMTGLMLALSSVRMRQMSRPAAAAAKCSALRPWALTASTAAGRSVSSQRTRSFHRAKPRYCILMQHLLQSFSNRMLNFCFHSKNAILCLGCLAAGLDCAVKWEVPLQGLLPQRRSIPGQQLQRLQLSLGRPAVGRGPALHTVLSIYTKLLVQVSQMK